MWRGLVNCTLFHVYADDLDDNKQFTITITFPSIQYTIYNVSESMHALFSSVFSDFTRVKP